MEHVAGPPSSASTRMSLGALTLAVLLHVAAALGLWRTTVDRPTAAPVEEVIEVTIEKPKPPQAEPKPEPQPQAQPKPPPATPPLQGLRPPAEITADRRSQVPPSGDQQKDITDPLPPSFDTPLADPQPSPRVATAESPKPKDVPPVEPPQPPPAPARPAVESLPPSSKDPLRIERTVPPAPAMASSQQPKEPPPQQPAKPPSPPPALGAMQPSTPPKLQALPAITAPPQPRATTQIARPQVRPPAAASRDTATSSSPFINPADVRNRALASENYIWQNARKFSFPVGELGRGYFLKVRVVIARDGRVVSADVAQSNGTPAMDHAILAAVHRNSPYLPLPPEIAGSQATFEVPLSNY